MAHVTDDLVKPGWQTTEFWVTLLGDAAAFTTFALHKDFSSYVPVGAVVMASISHVVYIVKRSNHKTTALQAITMLLPAIDSVAKEVSPPRKRAPSQK